MKIIAWVVVIWTALAGACWAFIHAATKNNPDD